MPAFTLGEIMSNATARVGRRSDLAPSTVSFWANAAYFEVAQAVPHELQEVCATSSVTSGQNRISMPTDLGEHISAQLRITSSASSTDYSYTTLSLLDTSEIDSTGPGSGVPTHFAHFNNYIELWPSPNSSFSLKVRYRAQVSDMTGTDAVPSLTTPWRYAVLLRTETLLHEYLGNPEGAHLSHMKYLDYVTRIDSDHAKRQKGKEARLVGVQVVY